MHAVKHNTPDEVRQAVADAVAIVEELEVPADLREAAFTFAAAQGLAKQMFFTQADQTPTVERAMAIPGGRLGR